MRILLFAPRIPSDPMDGGAWVVHHQIKNLRARGHHVTLVAPNTSRHHVDLLLSRNVADEIVTIDVTTDVTKLGALRSYFFDTSPRQLGLPHTPYAISRFLSEELLRAVEEHIHVNPAYDVMHVETLAMLWYAVSLQFDTLVVPILYRAHNIEHRIMKQLSLNKHKPLLERLYRARLAAQLKAYEEEIILDADFIGSISEADIDWYKDVAPETPCSVIPAGVDVVQRDDHTSNQFQTNIIGFLGSLEWQPNVEGIHWFVEQVLPLVQISVPNVQLQIAGRAPTADVNKLHDGKRVVVMGPVDSATTFLHNVDVCISPVLSGSGVRIKILEGLAHGCAMVTTTLGAEGLSVQHGEHLLIADSPQEFANACIQLLTSKEQATALGVRGQALVSEKYSWKQSTDAVLAAYSSMAFNL